MQQKTILILAALTIITGILGFVAINSRKPATVDTTPSPTPQQQIEPTQPVVEKSTKIYFEPSSLSKDATTLRYAADLMVDSGTNTLMAIQTDITFDPQVVSDVRITQPESNFFFGSTDSYIVLSDDIDTTKGTIFYSVGIVPRANAKSGVGSIARLTFTISDTSKVTGDVFTVQKTSKATDRLSNKQSVVQEVGSLTLQ